jgi:site-specific DNA-methyltransferase (adenine-specific)
VWTDIPPINSQAKERRGYPTQKPLALLERIIAASSNEGDIVLDPFAGCGTAIVAAERMNRHWIGIDVTYLAINEIIDRLNTEKLEGRDLHYKLSGTPKDLAGAEKLFEQTKAQNHKPFEQWAVSLVKGRWNDKKGADRGIDGRLHLWDLQGNLREALIQVKGGNAMNLSTVRDFANVIESNKAVLGIMIGMKEPTKEMLRVCEQMGYADWPSERKYPRYQILSIEGLLEKGIKPELPDSYRLQAQTGVGRVVDDGQGELFGDHT